MFKKGKLIFPQKAILIPTGERQGKGVDLPEEIGFRSFLKSDTGFCDLIFWGSLFYLLLLCKNY